MQAEKTKGGGMKGGVKKKGFVKGKEEPYIVRQAVNFLRSERGRRATSTVGRGGRGFGGRGPGGGLAID